MHLGEKIKKYRLENKITQQKLADSLGVSRSNIAEIERGKIKGTVKFITKLAQFTELPMSYWTDGISSGDPVEKDFSTLNTLIEAMIDTGAISDEGKILTHRDRDLILSVLEKEIHKKILKRANR